eukprot:209975-Chlamydomonas_euryale.AAC.4
MASLHIASASIPGGSDGGSFPLLKTLNPNRIANLVEILSVKIGAHEVPSFLSARMALMPWSKQRGRGGGLPLSADCTLPRT